MVELPWLLSSCRDLRGNDLAGGFVHVDELGAFFGEVLRDHLLDGNRGEARIADVVIHVGVGELLGFDHHVQRIDGVMPVLRHGKVLHDVEHGERGDALAVGRQLVDGPAAVGGGDGSTHSG